MPPISFPAYSVQNLQEPPDLLSLTPSVNPPPSPHLGDRGPWPDPALSSSGRASR